MIEQLSLEAVDTFVYLYIIVCLHVTVIKGVGSKFILGSAFLQMLELRSQTAAGTSLPGEVSLSPDRVSQLPAVSAKLAKMADLGVQFC